MHVLLNAFHASCHRPFPGRRRRGRCRRRAWAAFHPRIMAGGCRPCYHPLAPCLFPYFLLLLPYCPFPDRYLFLDRCLSRDR